jgi:electron transfer flavoprotein beta subunit
MNIIVCVKQVADPEAVVEVTGEGALQVENRWITGFFDEVAIEQALQLRDRFGGEVTAVTVGTGKATDALRRAVAMGASRAIQVDDPATADLDGVGVARALAEVLRTETADLILCGKASLDLEAGVVGPALAEFLGLPHLSEVVELEPGDDGATLVGARAVEGGRIREKVALPALITAGKGLVEPRVPPVTGVMKAMRTPIDRRSLADLGLDAPLPGWEVRTHHSPPKRAAVTMVEGEFPADVDALVGALQQKGALS